MTVLFNNEQLLLRHVAGILTAWCCCRLMWKKIGGPEFDIARNTLNIIYNQTLFFVGLYFSPLLAFIVVLKMFITFYVKKVGNHAC